MSLLRKTFSVCVFCYRNSTSPANTTNTGLLVKRFVKFVDRFVYNGKDNKLFKQTEMAMAEIPSDNLLNSCEDCKSLLESFCEDYHKIKCLELQLDWKLNNLGKIIKLASLVPSRRSVLNKHLDDIFVHDKDVKERSYESIKIFRKTITKAGQHKKRQSQPRVSVSHINSLNAPVLSNTQENENEETNQHADMSSDNEHYCEEFFSRNDEAVDITDMACSNTEMLTETLQGHLNETKLDLFTDVISETSDRTSFTPPSQAIYIENVILNTFSTHAVHGQTIKTEVRPQATASTEIIPHTDNLHLKFDDTNTEEIEQKVTGKVVEKNQIENFEATLENDNTAASSTSQQRRYRLRKKRASKIKQLDNNIADNNSNYSDFSVAENSCDLTVTKRRRRKTVFLKTQLERLNKRGYILCSSDGCQKRFRTDDSYKSHMKFHKLGKYPCHFCSLVETNLIKLSLHEYKIHSVPKTLPKDKRGNKKKKGKKLWTCPRCPDKSFISCALYLVHFSFTHFGIGKEPVEKTQKKTYEKDEIKCEIINGFIQFRCKFCKLPFKRRAEFLRHLRESHHSKSPQKTCVTESENLASPQIAENFKCNFCDSAFKYAPDLAIHEIEHAVPKMTTENMSKQNSRKTSKCPRCPFFYTLQAAYLKHHLKTHLNLLSGNYPGACKLCSGPDIYVANRKTHFDKFHNTALLEDPTKRFKCEYDNCPAYFLKSVQLYQHNISNHKNNSYKCEICDKVFKKKQNLVSHQKNIHKILAEDPNLPFACDRNECRKRFKTEGELELHKIFHAHTDKRKDKYKDYDNDEHEIICADCGKLCKSTEELTIHQRNVHVDRKFVCQECGKFFKLKYQLLNHVEYHKGPDGWKWECKECGKKCVDKYKLKAHMNTHTKEKPWICQFCGEKYAHRHNWRNHLKTKHRDEEGAQEDIKGMFIRTGVSLSRKGSKKGDCIIAGVGVEKLG